jgi:hypothetical protein
VSYELIVRSRARADIRRDAKRYEKQWKGLGVDFVAEVDTAIRGMSSSVTRSVDELAHGVIKMSELGGDLEFVD